MSIPSPYRLSLPYPPQANHLYIVARGRKVLSAEGRAYKETVGRLAFRLKPKVGPVRVLLDVYRPRRCGDLDNVFKVVLDAMKGTFWIDDQQVTEIHAHRHDDKGNPRVEVRVEDAPVETYASEMHRRECDVEKARTT